MTTLDNVALQISALHEHQREDARELRDKIDDLGNGLRQQITDGVGALRLDHSNLSERVARLDERLGAHLETHAPEARHETRREAFKRRAKSAAPTAGFAAAAVALLELLKAVGPALMKLVLGGHDGGA
jgi:hypothetical protein